MSVVVVVVVVAAAVLIVVFTAEIQTSYDCGQIVCTFVPVSKQHKLVPAKAVASGASVCVCPSFCLHQFMLLCTSPYL